MMIGCERPGGDRRLPLAAPRPTGCKDCTGGRCPARRAIPTIDWPRAVGFCYDRCRTSIAGPPSPGGFARASGPAAPHARYPTGTGAGRVVLPSSGRHGPVVSAIVLPIRGPEWPCSSEPGWSSTAITSTAPETRRQAIDAQTFGSDPQHGRDPGRGILGLPAARPRAVQDLRKHVEAPSPGERSTRAGGGPQRGELRGLGRPGEFRRDAADRPSARGADRLLQRGPDGHGGLPGQPAGIPFRLRIRPGSGPEGDPRPPGPDSAEKMHPPERPPAGPQTGLASRCAATRVRAGLIRDSSPNRPRRMDGKTTHAEPAEKKMRMRTDRSDDGPRKARKPRKGTDGLPAWSGPPIPFREGPRSCGQERRPPDGFLNTERTESTEGDRPTDGPVGPSPRSVSVYSVFSVFKDPNRSSGPLPFVLFVVPHPIGPSTRSLVFASAGSAFSADVTLLFLRDVGGCREVSVFRFFFLDRNPHSDDDCADSGRGTRPRFPVSSAARPRP